ncbi:MAG: NAD-dependent succinate-semialdehyde dehydrogenase [Gammaproteobacteria bacterium]|nr:MAG: NAD-dependent succinate-semialdehyde dehydrogenase [Gammaproteobacteria bacterium]
MKLTNTTLFQQSCYINGKWIHAKKTIKVNNPATEDILGTVPNLEPENMLNAMAATEKAWPMWRSKTAIERGELLYRWYTLILENINDLALILTLEQGKPFKEAVEEIRYGASFIQWFAEEGKRIYGDIIPAPLTDQHLFVSKQSVGVVGAITPWNFPNAMITRKCAPALAAGCTIILKPSVLTPFSALALAVLAEEAGIPAGVFNIVTGDSELIGNLFTDSPLIRKLSFTGSTAIGKLLMQKAASSVKKISLELGGNAPFIVFEDADIDRAILGAVASKFRNSGQTCICTNRFYIHEKIYEIFSDKLTQAIQQLKVGNGLEDNVQIGPLINEAAIKKVEKHIADAQQKGAELVCGGQIHNLGGNFFQPTLLKNCTANMLIAKEETFGPVAALFKFSEDKEAIHLANATEYGLAAYFYTQNINRVVHVGLQLDYGIVGVNTGRASNAVAPFGGFKQSGIGREGSKYGIEEYLEIKYVCLNTD